MSWKRVQGSNNLDTSQHFHTWGKKEINGAYALPYAQWITHNPKNKTITHHK